MQHGENAYGQTVDNLLKHGYSVLGTQKKKAYCLSIKDSRLALQGNR